MGGIEHGWTPENVRRGAGQAAAEALATHYVAKPFGKAANALGFGTSRNLDAAINAGSAELVDIGSAVGTAIWETPGTRARETTKISTRWATLPVTIVGDDLPSPYRFRR
ncbi:hypothetical protein [Sinorhizobium psoraleae]|uniref:Uncharacterized protein n=1 Tax=Sinorhizobium psoraleae TaxID=520838 RepID=A0ABT4KKW0_9HYPH|nr:hypothetical protein [Sinorhizobium psoraleae]MCZ4092583.1 hypothetical protein [Sinorhizobium psoraleae]